MQDRFADLVTRRVVDRIMNSDGLKHLTIAQVEDIAGMVDDCVRQVFREMENR